MHAPPFSAIPVTFAAIPVTFAAIHVTFAGDSAFFAQCVQSDLDRATDEWHGTLTEAHALLIQLETCRHDLFKLKLQKTRKRHLLRQERPIAVRSSLHTRATAKGKMGFVGVDPFVVFSVAPIGTCHIMISIAGCTWHESIASCLHPTGTRTLVHQRHAHVWCTKDCTKCRSALLSSCFDVQDGVLVFSRVDSRAMRPFLKELDSKVY